MTCIGSALHVGPCARRVVISTSRSLRTTEELAYDVGFETQRRNDSVDIPADVPEYVRPAFEHGHEAWSATTLVAFANDGVME